MTVTLVVALLVHPNVLVNVYVRVYVPTAVAVGTKLNPETPIPLQLPPLGVPSRGTNVSLIHILLVERLVTVTTGIGLTVRVAAAELTNCPQLLVKTNRYRLPLMEVVVGDTVRVVVYEPPVVRLVQVAPPLVLTCHW
jgi:hypothetical protein